MTAGRQIFKLIGELALALAAVSLQISLVPQLPFPLKTVNLILVLPTLYLLSSQPARAIWFAFGLHFFAALYIALPFVWPLLIGALTFLIVFCLSQTLIVNRTVAAALLLSVSTLLVYRLLYVAAVWFVGGQMEALGARPGALALNYLYELLFTTLLVVGLFHAGQKYLGKFKSPTLIRSRIRL